MGNAKLGLGSTLKVNNNLVGGLKNLAIPETVLEMVDVTSHDSTSGYKEKIPGLKDVPEMTFTCNYIAADVGQAYVRANLGAETTWEMAFPNGATIGGDCIVGGNGGEAPYDKEMSFTFKLIPTGAPEFTEGT